MTGVIGRIGTHSNMPSGAATPRGDWRRSGANGAMSARGSISGNAAVRAARRRFLPTRSWCQVRVQSPLCRSHPLRHRLRPGGPRRLRSIRLRTQSLHPPPRGALGAIPSRARTVPSAGPCRKPRHLRRRLLLRPFAYLTRQRLHPRGLRPQRRHPKRHHPSGSRCPASIRHRCPQR